MEAKASVDMVRIAPRKVRLVIDEVRGKSAFEAWMLLSNAMNRAAAPVVFKLLKSAVANVIDRNELGLDVNDMDEELIELLSSLYITEIFANEGPTMKRFMPRAQGRATAINKRTSKIGLVVTQRA